MKRINLLLWKINDPIDRRPGHQITDFIIQKIQNNEARPGDRLPSQRAFAKLNHLNCNTVKRAYANLVATNWLTTQLGSGTFVKRNGTENEGIFTSTGFVNKLPIDIKPQSSVTAFADTITQNFATIGLNTLNPYNYPERSMFKFRRQHRKRYKATSQIEQINEFYGSGYKEAIRSYFNDCRDFKLNPGCMNIVFGREESLNRVFQAILNQGDAVINTSAQDLVLREVLCRAKAKFCHLSTLDVDFIEKLEDLARGSNIKMLYLRPQCGYPECNVIPEDTCVQILELAKKYKFFIVEEDDYHELWYKKSPYKPLACYDHQGHVIYLGALSQLSVYTRNTRVVAAAKELIGLMNMVQEKPCEFRDVIEENAIIEMINSGDLSRHVSEIRRIKEKDRDNLLWVLNNYLDRFMEIQAPDSGLAFWLRFPDVSTLGESLDFLEEKEIDVPYNPETPPNDLEVYDMYLGFGTYNEVEAEAAAKFLRDRFEDLLCRG